MSESTPSAATAAAATADSHPPPSSSSDSSSSSSADSFVMLTPTEPTNSSGGAAATPVKKEGGEEDVGMELDNGGSSEEAKGGHSKEEGAAGSSSSSSPPNSSSSRKRAASALNRSDDEDGEESDPTKCDDCGEPFAAEDDPEAKDDGVEDEERKEPSRVPRCLPCGHTLCTASVSAMLEADGHVNCPHGCVASDALRLHSAKQLPINDALLRLIGQLKRSNKKQRAEESPSVKCNSEVCDEKAEIHCASCDQDLCTEHDNNVHEAASSHLRVPIKDQAALFKALADEDTFKQIATNCKANIQEALGEIAATGATLAKAKKGHTDVCTQLDKSVVSLVEVRSAADKIIQTAQAQTQLHQSKLEEVEVCEAKLPTLQREATALLQASDVEVVTGSPEFKRKMAQLKASEASACSGNSADGLKRIDESIAALRKTALAVPFVQANLLGSAILAGSASELQNMLGDFSLSGVKLLYRGSRDGWTYNDWAAKCVGQANTLTLIKVAGSGNVMGAFTAPVWSAQVVSGWIPDPTKRSFNFSLANAHDRPVKFALTDSTYAMCHSSQGVGLCQRGIVLMEYGKLLNDINASSESGVVAGCTALDDEYERKCGRDKPTFSLTAGFMSGMPDGKFTCAEIEVFAMKPQQQA